MRIDVEGPDEWGNESYAELFKRILLDLGATRVVEHVRLIIRPEDPLFLVSVKMRGASSKRTISQVAEVTPTADGAFIKIMNENYAPAILDLLWKRYRRDMIDQLTRFEIIAREVDPEEVSALEVDSGEKAKQGVLDAIWRVFPEGFKTRHNLVDEDTITIATTEAVMRPEWKELAERVHREMGGPIDV
jgi:putative methanogenesis marker protein 17